MQRRGGMIAVKIDGVVQLAKGSWSYNLGRAKREPIIGSDGVHGYKETPQAAYIEGEITDRSDLDLAALVEAANSTVTLELANGKVIVLREAAFTGDGTASSDEGAIQVRFDGSNAEEIA